MFVLLLYSSTSKYKKLLCIIMPINTYNNMSFFANELNTQN